MSAFARGRLGVALHADPPDRAAMPFDRAAWDACADFGFFAMPVSEHHDGLGNDTRSCVSAMRALARASPARANSLLFAASAHMGGVAMPLDWLGDEGQRAAWLPELARGTRIAGMPLWRGSGDRNDGAHVQVRRDGRSLILDGVVPMVGNALVADLFLVWADTSTLAARDGVTSATWDEDTDNRLETALLVPRDTPGLTVLDPVPSVGLRGASVADLRFSGCAFDEAAILGRVHGGQAARYKSFSWHSSLALAAQLGRMEWQLERAADHARTRHQFGRPIGEFQAIGHRLADMKTRLELGRLLLDRLAWNLDSGQDAMLDAAMARAFVTESYIESSRAIIQIYGGQGYMSESGVAEDLSDALVGHVYLGASEVPRDIIAHLMGLAPLEV